MSILTYKEILESSRRFEAELLGIPQDGIASDRAAAIMSAAFLDGRLRIAIESRFVKDKDARNKLLKPGGPVGDLGSKANLGYLLGLYDKDTRKDIGHIAQIRNWFAHWDEVVDFGDRRIKEVVEKIRIPQRILDGWPEPRKPFNRNIARQHFLSSCSIATGLVATRIKLDSTEAGDAP